MSAYKIPIEFAFIVFPFIAFILTIPFLIHQYRKYGAIPILKSAIFYSLILYLICAYFLVMLPLPSIESVRELTTPTMQLKLFQFINDIRETTAFHISSLSDLLRMLKQPTVYTVLFNVALTLPFGVYLHYFFDKKWYESLLLTFCLSLFFELTQLSGLYGIYPRPYRLFDVDDLLINTLGGLIGHIITPLFTLFLPSKEELEAKSYEKGMRVTLLRRFMSFTIDFLFLMIGCLVFKILTYETLLAKYYVILALALYYLIIPLITSGKTLGKKVLRLQIAGFEGPAHWYQILIRNILFAFLTIYPYCWISIIAEKFSTDVIKRLWIVIIIYQTINILYYIITISATDHLFIYEKLTGTKNISTIENDHTRRKLAESSTEDEHKQNSSTEITSSLNISNSPPESQKIKGTTKRVPQTNPKGKENSSERKTEKE